ncbi:hypothetical protein BDA99DRAFT_71157 [Phascolomyces articulosus]|uniref:Uncharacterized protein n=1 Tax=Phascolomyces articulosus TaxID=60185 RepID=A0AAD5K9Q1_9FUNG|nr:hypothetical protein BDA99DRAFT_71157 [Phascolomyces articulosus]
MVKVPVDDNVIDKYFSAKSEWKSGKRSDMVFITRQQSLPAIIVEIQNAVNNSFVLKLNEYCLNANDEYGRKPVSIVFSIKNTTKTILKESPIQTSTFFARTLLSFPWTEECILLDAYTTKEHINLWIC